MQELIVLGLVPGTDIYIPFYYWLITGIILVSGFCFRRLIATSVFRFATFLLGHKIEHDIKKQQLS